MVIPIRSSTDRMMARIAIVIFSLGAMYGLVTFGRPVYWRFYATVLRPFEDVRPGGVSMLDDNGISASVMGQQQKNASGEGASGTAVLPAVVTESPALKVKAPFDVNDYPFTKERIHGLLQDGYIMVTWANHHYLDFAKSWVHHVRQAGVTGYIVGAMDDEILEALANLDINTWRMNSNISKIDLGWGSPNFHKMGRVKISLIKQFLEVDVVLLISDIDTAWLQNPLPYLSRFPEAQILTSTDHLKETVKDDGLELWPTAGSSFNIGIMMFRPSSMAFVDEWIKKLADPQMWDQSAFNDIVRQGATHSNSSMKNLWMGDNGKLVVGILPAALFASGHMFFVQRKYEELGLKPYVAHATFQYSGTPGKRNRFREFLLWDDPPEYFDHPKGFIHINIEVPKEMLDKAIGVQGMQTEELMVNHLNMVHFQLLRLRTALALATITGRVLVLPTIWCEIDKYWAPLHNGNIPGSMFKKPFICPMDHVLDIESGWARPESRPANEFGPNIEWREYSFFQNPRLSAAVNNSRLAVLACSGDCPGGAKTTAVKDGKMSVASGADAAVLGAALSEPPVAAYKILEVPFATLEVLSKLYTTFPEPDRIKFENRLKHASSVVCCLHSSPGWIWYDFFNDIPHVDRFGRKFESDKLRFYRGDSNEVAYNAP